jgi:hypothetical protein
MARGLDDFDVSTYITRAIGRGGFLLVAISGPKKVLFSGPSLPMALEMDLSHQNRYFPRQY